MIRVYCDYHTPTIRYACDDGDWFIVPAVHDGWSQRTAWHPSTFMKRKVEQEEYRVSFYGHAWLAELTLGIPADRVEVVTFA